MYAQPNDGHGAYPQHGYPQGPYPHVPYPQPAHPHAAHAEGAAGHPHDARHPPRRRSSSSSSASGHAKGAPHPHEAYSAHPQGPANPGYLENGGQPDRAMRRQVDWDIPDEKLLNEDVDDVIRRGFIKKVMCILSAQLAVSFAVACAFTFSTTVQDWVYENVWFAVTVSMMTMVLAIVFACIPKVARTFPINYVILFLLALGIGCSLGYGGAYYGAESFSMALGITVLITLALMGFAFQTKWDFTGSAPYMAVVSLCVLVFGLIAAIIRTRIAQIVYASIGAALFACYIVLDTQMIIGGKHKKYQFGIDDYAFAALALYMDIVNLFMMILTLIGSSSE